MYFPFKFNFTLKDVSRYQTELKVHIIRLWVGIFSFHFFHFFNSFFLVLVYASFLLKNDEKERKKES